MFGGGEESREQRRIHVLVSEDPRTVQNHNTLSSSFHGHMNKEPSSDRAAEKAFVN